MTLTEVAEEYLSGRDLCPNYQRHLLRTAERMTSCGLTSVADLTPQRVTRWLDSLVCSKTTKANYRRQALTIIRAAVGPGVADFNEAVRRVKCSVSPPVAWSEKELERLLAAASDMKRTLMSGCPASLFFRAWILTGYFTGLRFSDELHLRVNQLRGDRLHHVISKTSQPYVKVLDREVVDLLGQLANHPANPDGKTFFSWALKEHWLRVWFRRLCRQAGLEGTPKWLRRSGATACEAQSPGSASRYLAHRSPELALKYYVDASLLPDAMPTPPRLQHKRVS